MNLDNELKALKNRVDIYHLEEEINREKEEEIKRKARAKAIVKRLKAKKKPNYRKRVKNKGSRSLPTFGWWAYKNKAWRITEAQPLYTLENIELRGFKDYHLDHKISIWDGYKLNIPAEKVGHISNLRMIPHTINERKGIKSHVDKHNCGSAQLALRINEY